MTIHIKDPDAIVDYSVKYGNGYLDVGETISTSVWEISPAIVGGLAFNTLAAGTADTNSTQIFVKGGVTGDIYKLTNRIVTSNGRTDDRTFTIRIENR